MSGSPKSAYYRALHVLAGAAGRRQEERFREVRDCMAGEVYDSGPVDFTSKQGVMALSSQKGGLMAWLVNSGVETVACTMDFFLVEWLEADRRRYWDTLRSSLVKGPALFLYSEADPFVD
ncbi:unnamed protein product, partial [Ostreobium quekettii]